ncbi:MAG: N-6 DNA methylase [Chthoniobacteraceae bacterium]
MPSHSFASFEKELNRLVATFEKNFAHYKKAGYDEASLRQEFLNPLFSALGWDVENKAGHIPQKREVEVESRTQIGGRAKRADYLFRTDGRDRFVCEAKKPSVDLDAKEAFQAKRYAWNKDLPLAVLTDFEEMIIYVVGGKPHADEPGAGEWKTWHFRQYPLVAQELWDLLSREKVAGGAIDAALDALPKKKPTGKGKAKQQWLIRPDRSRALDTDFLEFLDEARRDLASDLYKHNDHAALIEGNLLNESVQCILDRILFLRICEDRDIDTGTTLQNIVETWRRNYGHDEGRKFRQESMRLREDSTLDLDDDARSGGTGGTGSTGGGRIAAPRESLWYAIVRHFRALDRRPPSHVPFFNGNLFKLHGSEKLLVSDEWLADFIGELSNDETPYLFNVIPVEILGSVYERFLGKVVRPHGKGIVVEEKPEVRKAGGVYYTPRYIVDYIVEQTVGKLVEGVAPEKSVALRILDPACGSGSFLIRAFERVCEHWQEWLTKNPDKRKKKWCWVDAETGDIHLTVDLKRRILTENIYGVDLDSAAVEVTQLSLYLKMLENENRTTLQRERELFADEIALLPPLQDNIKCGNSLIASDFSMMSEDLVRVNAFDWDVQFRDIMKAGGFDAVIGNPPYVRQESLKDQKDYFERNYEAFSGTGDLYTYFMEKGVKLIRPGGRYSIIVSSSILRATYAEALRDTLLRHAALVRIVDFGGLAVFADAKDTYVCIPVFAKAKQPPEIEVSKVASLDEKQVNGDMNKTAFTAPLSQFTRDAWALRSPSEIKLFGKITKRGTPLGEYVNKQLFYGIKTGLNEAFAVTTAQKNELIASSPKSSALIHPSRGGEDVREYFIEPADVWMIVLPAGFTRKAMGPAGQNAPETKAWAWLNREHPGIASHLEPFSKALKARQDQGDFWWELRPCDYYDVFAKPKIVFPDICKFPRFCYDDTGIYLTNTAYALGTGDKYLVGILTSRVFWFAISHISIPFGVRAGEFRYRLIYQYMEKVPIRALDLSKPDDKAAHKKMVALVEKRMALTPKLRAAKTQAEKATLQNAVTATDRQIDQLVYELYGLTPEEIALVEGTSEK